ncbi:hypothetical protein NLU13_4181 [Sarocladium strictum]|uniref:Uncharacterized protein n=1 Tax=Sarocladium strictum TaxID=5046 RepID=A0AA39GIR1_SARSR|nr:hypothetical protein NLU13_4181 [Sarocladium strictum]
MAQGLGVRHHAPSYPVRDWFGPVDSRWPYGSRPSSSSRPRRRTESDGAQPPMSHARSASNLLDVTQQPLTTRTAHNRSASNLLDGGKRQQRSAAQSQSRSQQIAELVDFLRNYDPPSDSWTSQPFDDEDRGRWSRLRNMSGLVKRSKSVPKLSRQIRLPDSAVCGTTIGGHRHIAISIPMEASPFGLMPRSQYPVYHQPVRSHLLDPASPVRYLNDKGVITVLRPGTESTDTHISRGSFPGFRLSIPPSPGPPPSKALPSAATGLSRSRSNTTNRDPERLAPPECDQNTLKTVRHTEPQSDSRNIHAMATPPRRTSSAHGLYPPKTSATVHRASIARPSIDGIIANNTVTTKAPTTAKKQRPISESSATEDEEPILGHAVHWAHPMQGSSQKEESKATRAAKKTEAGGAIMITENPLATTDEQETPPPTPRTTESRRDKVRNLKKRHMASIRTTLRGQEVGSSRSAEPDEAAQPEVRGTPLLTNRYAPVNTLSPIMVVTSIEPVQIPSTKPLWNERKRKDLEITPPGSGFITKVEKNEAVGPGLQSDEDESSRTKSLTIPQARRARARASLSPRAVKKSCNPTPPLSPARTPRRANSTIDRTSLSRRREWNATRCKARRVQAVVDAAKGKKQEETKIIEALKDVQAADRDQEFLNLYEAYREHRLRDMERRVRRLERHGDVWMRALVPVLDNLNRTMISGKRDLKQENDDLRGWRSDDETMEERVRGRTRHRSLPLYNGTRQNSLSAERQNSEVRKRNKKRNESPRDSDDSGLDTLEPLMRELAGAAQERLKNTERLTGKLHCEREDSVCVVNTTPNWFSYV